MPISRDDAKKIGRMAQKNDAARKIRQDKAAKAQKAERVRKLGKPHGR